MTDASCSDSFDGKVAIVTGGGGGLGSATCRELVARGARVAIVDLKGSRELAEELGLNKCLAFEADVSNEDHVDKVISETIEKFGGLDCVFSNAGILRAHESFIETSTDSLLKTFKVNLMGSFLMVKMACRKLIALEREDLSVVCTSSIASIRADVAPIDYSISKAGLLALVRSAQDFMLSDPRMRRMRVNAILPGGIVTDMWTSMAQNFIDRKEYVEGFDSKKFNNAEPQNIAKIVLFLLSPESQHIRGQAIVCDGGWSNSLGMKIKKAKKQHSGVSKKETTVTNGTATGGSATKHARL